MLERQSSGTEVWGRAVISDVTWVHWMQRFCKHAQHVRAQCLAFLVHEGAVCAWQADCTFPKPTLSLYAEMQVISTTVLPQSLGMSMAFMIHLLPYWRP